MGVFFCLLYYEIFTYIFDQNFMSVLNFQSANYALINSLKAKHAD